MPQKYNPYSGNKLKVVLLFAGQKTLFHWVACAFPKNGTRVFPFCEFIVMVDQEKTYIQIVNIKMSLYFNDLLALIGKD